MTIVEARNTLPGRYVAIGDSDRAAVSVVGAPDAKTAGIAGGGLGGASRTGGARGDASVGRARLAAQAIVRIEALVAGMQRHVAARRRE